MLRRSSNVGMAFLETQLIGDERFAAGIDKFGIGHTTGIDFPGEATGIVRSLDEYEGPTGGNMAFGQVLQSHLSRSFAHIPLLLIRELW